MCETVRLCDCVCEVSGCSVWGRRVGSFVMSPDVSSGRARWPGARACSAPRCSCPPVLCRTSHVAGGLGIWGATSGGSWEDPGLGWDTSWDTSCGAAILMTVVTRDEARLQGPSPEKSNCGSGRPAQLEPG